MMSSEIKSTRAVRTGAAALKALALCMALTASSMATAAATSVSYLATDLTDAKQGEDLWRYDYVFTGPLSATTGLLELIFSPAKFKGLVASSLDVDNVLFAQDPDLTTDPGNPLDGLVFLTRDKSLLDGDSTAFSVDFIWTGLGAPGSQTFNVSEADPASRISGSTQEALGGNTIPEPAGISLALAALLAAGVSRQRSGR